MEAKDIILVIIAILGWAWAIVQYLINRRLQKKDKLNDRRYEAYSSYMKKSDELMQNFRTDPNMIFGITTEFFKEILNGDQDLTNNALLKFNEKLLEFVRKATEPLMILNQELNSLKLVCSKDLISKILEFDSLANDFNNEVCKTLSLISPNDSNTMTRQLETLSHSERWVRFESLNKEILDIMRKEIGNN